LPRATNTRLLAHIDCDGGGQVWLDRHTLYVAHMQPPSGTSIFDVSDPSKPRPLAHVEIPQGWHSHKVRAEDGIMIVNHEKFGDDNPGFGGGLGIYDVSSPDRPRLITKWRTPGSGVHRYDFDGRYAYISPTADGFIGNIVKILDLADPAKPKEVGAWWLPGQHAAAGETYPWGDGVKPRCHHPLRMGNRLYVSYWHHGLHILDISDLTKPKLVSSVYPGNPHPTHTCLPVPKPLKGRNVMVVADEDVAKLRPSPPSFAWVYDISDETTPKPISKIKVPGLDTEGPPQPPMTGCHQPSEIIAGTVVPFAWFAQGLRLFDLADPLEPREVGSYQPDPPPGCERVCSNDVTVDPRGIVYLTDRQRGLDIVECRVS
jgi:hypothetical protein